MLTMGRTCKLGRSTRAPFLLPVFALTLSCMTARSRTDESLPPEVRTARLIDEFIESGDEVGFAYTVVSKDGPLFEYRAGKLDAAREGTVELTTKFLSASTTKVLTALAILRLVDQGHLRLEDPLSRFVPEHPYGEGVTIRGLLSHTAGLPNPLPLKWLHTEAEHKAFNPSEQLKQVAAENPKLAGKPGEKYRYTNLGYYFLGEVVLRVTGRRYEEFVTQELFEPLGITPSEISFDVEDWASQASGHYARWSMLGLSMPLLTPNRFRAPPAGAWGRLLPLYMNGPAYGGAFANVRGYGKVLSDLLRERSVVLSKASVELLFTAERSTSGEPLPTSVAFCLGDLEGERYFSKAGGGPGFSANLRVYRRLGLATVWLSNQMRATESAIQKVSDTLDAPFIGPRRHTPHVR
jgi:D-alanyl-D-alanine carboxypeptidase